MMIDFKCRLRIAFSRWFRALPLSVSVPVPVVAPQPMSLEARPVVILDRLPYPRRGRTSRGAFALPAAASWDSPAPDARPHLHAEGLEYRK